MPRAQDGTRLDQALTAWKYYFKVVSTDGVAFLRLCNKLAQSLKFRVSLRFLAVLSIDLGQPVVEGFDAGLDPDSSFHFTDGRSEIFAAVRKVVRVESAGPPCLD